MQDIANNRRGCRHVAGTPTASHALMLHTVSLVAGPPRMLQARLLPLMLSCCILPRMLQARLLPLQAHTASFSEYCLSKRMWGHMTHFFLIFFMMSCAADNEYCLRKSDGRIWKYRYEPDLYSGCGSAREEVGFYLFSSFNAAVVPRALKSATCAAIQASSYYCMCPHTVSSGAEATPASRIGRVVLHILLHVSSYY